MEHFVGTKLLLKLLMVTYTASILQIT